MRYLEDLTKAENRIAEKILLGYSRPDIAKIFEIRPAQVTRIMNSVYAKANVACRDEFMAKRIAELEDLLYKSGIDYE